MKKTLLLLTAIIYAMTATAVVKDFKKGIWPVTDFGSEGSLQIYVSRYQGDRPAAISYTFDDGLLEHYTVLRGQLAKHGFPATFAIVGSKVGRDFKGTPVMTWEQIRQLHADGHEIASHGWEHRNVTVLTPEELRREVQANDSIIIDSVGVRPRTFVYPGNRRSKESVAACEAGRTGSRTRQMSLGSKRTDGELRRWVDGLVSSGGWGITMTHGISCGYDHFADPGILWRHFDHVDSLRQSVWVATLADVTAYTREQRAVRISIREESGGSVTVTPSLRLDRDIFNVPLTLVVCTDRTVSAVQDGRPLEVVVKAGRRLIGFNPHGGPIALHLY
ncbi:MAG: polysaccharide deacetylase family protein [Prevotella sp.]|nr:polysaccharide deacetylase family protein [Prevotella sp.]